MIYTITSQILLTIYTLILGSSILILTKISMPNAFQRVGAAYFFGLIYLISSVRLAEYLLGDAKVSFLIVFATSLILVYKKFTSFKGYYGKITAKLLFFQLLVTVTLFVFLYIFWANPEAKTDDPFASIGTLHSVRYAWISDFINHNNYIPILQQNTGQSILLYINLLTGSQHPFLSLSLWLTSSIYMLGMFLFGLFRTSFNWRESLLSSIVFVVGQNTLSFSHILTLDSGSPILINGYTDTIVGIFSVLFIFKIAKELTQTNYKYKSYGLLTLLICSNFLVAPQNVVLLVCMLGLVILIPGLRPWRTNIFLGVFASLALSFSLMIPLGGMLTPSVLTSDLEEPGLMKVSRAVGVEGHIRMVPGIAFHYGWSGQWRDGLQDLYSFKAGTGGGFDDPKFRDRIVWNIEQIFVTSLRLFFFTLVGLFYLALSPAKSKNFGVTVKKGIYRLDTQVVGSVGLILFLIGFSVNFLFSFNGYKWELTRFMIPATTLGAVGMALFIAELLQSRHRNLRLAGVLLLIFAVTPPIVNILLVCYANLQVML